MTGQKEANRLTIPQEVSGLDPQRPIVSHMPHQWRIEDQDEIDFMSAVRCGDWKLVYRMHAYQDRTKALELYNIREDIGEKHNVAAQHPEIVARLAKVLGDRLRSWNASMPIVRATGKPVPWPDEIVL